MNRIVSTLLGAALGALVAKTIGRSFVGYPDFENLKVSGAEPGTLGGEAKFLAKCEQGVALAPETNDFAEAIAKIATLGLGVKYVCVTQQQRDEYQTAWEKASRAQINLFIALLLAGGLGGYALGEKPKNKIKMRVVKMRAMSDRIRNLIPAAYAAS